MHQVLSITSRDNPLLKGIRQLVRDPAGYRKQGQVWVEGDHLVRAALERGYRPKVVIFSDEKWPSALSLYGFNDIKLVVVSELLMRELSALEIPTTLGGLFDLPPMANVKPDTATVVLDRVQDAGNVGSILRCAAAFGYGQVLSLKGTAALWASKTLRAGMGAHFGLHMVEGLSEAALDALNTPLVVTSSHVGEWLHHANVPWPCAWVMGHEGQGVSASLQARAAHHIRIAQPGGEESLNVAAAAAICLYATAAKP